MPRRTRNVLVVLAAVFAVGVACDTVSDDTPDTTMTVTLVNDSDVDVHLLTEGEEMSQANRVAPGGTRLVSLVRPGVGSRTYAFRTVRPEGLLGSIQCTATPETDLSVEVGWDGDRMLCGATW